MLRLAKRYLPLETVQMMYRSLIEPYFRYCYPVRGSAGSAKVAEIAESSFEDCYGQFLLCSLGATIKRARLAYY